MYKPKVRAVVPVQKVHEDLRNGVEYCRYGIPTLRDVDKSGRYVTPLTRPGNPYPERIVSLN